MTNYELRITNYPEDLKEFSTFGRIALTGRRSPMTVERVGS
jgi:hypothetical protein